MPAVAVQAMDITGADVPDAARSSSRAMGSAERLSFFRDRENQYKNEERQTCVGKAFYFARRVNPVVTSSVFSDEIYARLEELGNSVARLRKNLDIRLQDASRVREEQYKQLEEYRNQENRIFEDLTHAYIENPNDFTSLVSSLDEMVSQEVWNENSRAAVLHYSRMLLLGHGVEEEKQEEAHEKAFSILSRLLESDKPEKCDHGHLCYLFEYFPDHALTREWKSKLGRYIKKLSSSRLGSSRLELESKRQLLEFAEDALEDVHFHRDLEEASVER